MGDVSVDGGATAKLGQVEGDLRVGQAARIEPEDKVIHVTGRVSCDGDAEFHGSLSCSEFSARHGKIRIEGDLVAKSEVKVDDGQLAIDGSLEAATVTVDKALRIGGNARADDFDVGGVLEVRGTISGKKVDVGGSFKVQGTAEVEEVDVGGTVDIASIVKFAKLDVGGMARIGGGEVSKDVDVGGKFESTKPLKFSKIDVGGLATLVEGGEGGDVDVGGKFESRADLSFNSLDVGGMASINGNGKGVEVDVGGLLRVSGSLTLEKDLDIGGRAYIGDLIIAQKSIEVGGDLKTIKGTKGDTVELGHGSRASGPIVAREVSVGHGGRVEDVYADTLEMEHGSRARNLYFREGVIEAGVNVEGEVLYTDTIEASPDVRFAKPSAKVNELPKPPL